MDYSEDALNMQTVLTQVKDGPIAIGEICAIILRERNNLTT